MTSNLRSALRSTLSWQFTGRFLRLSVPLVLVLAVVLWLIYRTQTAATLIVMEINEQQSIQLASQTIDAVFGVLRGDALYLAESSSLQQWLDTATQAARSHLHADFLAFVRHRRLYDQVRFLDGQGQEVVRVNWNDGRPEVIAREQLQTKQGRYYVRNTLVLNKGTVFLSAFDLNVENGVIEQPIKPTIRLSTPVFDSEGLKRGIVVLNYRGQRLLDRLRAIGENNPGGLWLLNEKSYWLLGPRPEVEWGFMYPDRETMRFDHEYGEAVWLSMLHGPQIGQRSNEQGLFTYRRIMPKKPQIASTESEDYAGGEQWIAVAHVPRATINASTAGQVRNLTIAFMVLTPLLVLLSGIITYHGMRRRQAEAKAQASEERYRGLLESAPDAIVIANSKGRVTMANAQTEKWFGYNRDDLIGQPIEKLVPDRFRAAHPAHRQNYLASPVVRPMGAGLELYGRRKDGSEFPVEISLSPLQTDQGVLVTSIIRDITARKHAEEAQEQTWMRYQKLVNNLPVGVYRNKPDQTGRFLEANQAMADILEAESIEQLLAYPFSELYCDPADRKTFIDTVMGQGHVHNHEVRLKTLRGREFHAALTAVMKKDVTDEIYFDGILEDVSERKEAERKIRQLNDGLRARSVALETINQELEAFSYSVSHDLRAPLRAIDGFSRTLLNEYTDRLDEKGRDRLCRVRAAAQRMANLIDDLLKLSRITRAELKRESVDLSQLAGEVIALLREDEPERTVRFSIQPGMIAHGDARLLRVVMDNLLGNAWKFTNHRAEAAIEVGCNPDETLTYFVRDNGAGFDMAYADKLFGAFQRLHDASEFSGTGIGLATVQRVIHKHGGRIWARSAVDQGAVFYFTLNEQKTNAKKDNTAGGRQPG
ncbi:PAS domain S-box-containing protein [Nitrosomonas sp. Nm51]|uniref:sensor histidine kinase n=1 Tax=Nitrosomonas sp. Nm51 TaxID=133720 RepID=UPI0008B693C5|nr:PAS domain S-box protein [Nitrosomonas sp. Nm51]SER45928.1 PAS domain S-box-containing protein [Nitrosomonas sp. Nm51]